MTTVMDVQAVALTPHFGAVIEGVDVKSGVSDADITAIKDAVTQYKVIFLREQNLSAAEHFAFAANFGAPYDGGAGKVSLDYDEVGVTSVTVVPHFHADLMYMEEGPAFSLLQMLVIPEVGGDTMWADLDSSYQALSEPMKAFLRPLVGVHVMPHYRLPDEELAALHKRAYGEDLGSAELAALRHRMRPRQHPLVRRIPESGTVNYWLSEQHTEAILGLSARESRAVLRMLFDHQLRPEFVLRWRWKVGDIAFWDNRRTLHSGINDYGSQPRRGQRASVAPNTPIPA